MHKRDIFIITISFLCLVKFHLVESHKLGKPISGRSSTNQTVPSISSGISLESKAVIEAGCPPRKAMKDLKPEFFNKVAAWYVPAASKYFYYRWGEALINRSLGASELPSVCMKWLFLAPTTPKGKYNVIVGGYHRVASHLCQDTGYLTQTCEAVKGSPGYHKGFDSIQTVVASDNKSWLMLAGCVNKKYKEWAVLTSDKRPMDQALHKIIMAEVKNQGFELNFAESLKYDACHKTKTLNE